MPIEKEKGLNIYNSNRSSFLTVRTIQLYKHQTYNNINIKLKNTERNFHLTINLELWNVWAGKRIYAKGHNWNIIKKTELKIIYVV